MWKTTDIYWKYMITHCTFPHVHLFWLTMVDYCLMFLRYLLQYWSRCQTCRTFSYQPTVMTSYWKLVTLGLPGESSMSLIIALIFIQAQFFLASSTKWHDFIRLFMVVILFNSIHSDICSYWLLSSKCLLFWVLYYPERAVTEQCVVKLIFGVISGHWCMKI